MPFFRTSEADHAIVLAGGGPLTTIATEYELDEQGRPIATGQTETVVLFLDGGFVRSEPEATAPALIQTLAQAAASDSALRTKLRTLVQGAVGKNVDPTAPNALSAAERNAINAVRWYREGIIDQDGNVRPVAEWFK